MTRRSRKVRPHYILNLGLSLVVLGIFSLTGAQVAGITSAATANPYGYADYCELENNATVIYGWAADPDSTSLAGPSITINAGDRAITVPTNRAGYRDAAVNAWIDANRPGDPKPGTYGFRTAIPGLYKGNQYTITGTVLNEGAGQSVILTINNSNYVDGDTSKPFFAGNQIPQGCLADAPAPPSAPPSQPPAGSAPAQPKPQPSSPATPAPANGSLSGEADGKVSAGTLAAKIVIPAGGAAKLHISYGKDPLRLDQSTPDQPVTGDTVEVALAGLDPTASYTYQIVRTDAGGKTTTSPPATFNTLGFIIALHFVDSHGKPVQGIPATINVQKNKKTSDEQGNLQFIDVPEGSHTVTYTYQNKDHTKRVTADDSVVSPATAAAAHVVTIDYTIDIQKAAGTPAKAPVKDSSPLTIIIPVVVGVIALVLAAIGLTRRRKNRKYQDFYEDFPAAPLPEYKPPVPPPSTAPPDRALHTGESLKDMVLRSMAEEAKRRESENKKNP